jgi:hypothetical protein
MRPGRDDPKSQENPVVGAKCCGAQIMLDLLCSATYIGLTPVIGTGGSKEKENVMVKKFDEIQKLGQESANAATTSLGVVSKGVQAIATEVADYSKKSFEEGTQAFEQLLGTKSVEKAMELQQVYFKNAYEGFVTHATKIGALYADLVKETYKPFEGYVAKITPAK